jgi:hypothetical protein
MLAAPRISLDHDGLNVAFLEGRQRQQLARGGFASETNSIWLEGVG